MFDDFRQDLGSIFPIKDLGESKWLLGMFIERDHEKGWICLSQTAYINVILNRFGMTECKSAKTPYSTEKFDGGQVEVTKFPFRELIGHLMYLANMTRPDISQAVGYLSRFVSCFTNSHVIAVKHILRYLKGTVEHGITFMKDEKFQIQLFSDSDFAGDQEDRKSTSGALILMNGGPVLWNSKKQSCVAKSTAEAEYIALSSLASEAIWMKHFLEELPQEERVEPWIIKEDNQSCIAIANQTTSSSKSKHIDVHFHFIRDLIKRNILKIEYEPTETMFADMFTKAQGGVRFIQHRKAIGIHDVKELEEIVGNS